ncbi:DUF58 domain-containing protein [Myroides odoratimimus]|uniref:DUF58 domain-containing protein n=1 Tax=Myroides odoratimimus CIP 101113 TaxID=883154 RepID=A0AAV3F4J9_9FLAO|nr:MULTISPECIES: DUF58 domain-containing protein [Myroides]AJA69514.1 putative conserved protein (some members containing a von Willebrand factor type A (vWA) domain) [Myroides sp. A21]EHO13411.1 hypothetical protein HMPREF9715_01285 [Myroides odoratimimus CIP 101113]EKB07737.1 hypothetical protein HMPREF9711_00027 [Myroides odoratimimus CCUG 3837]EPH11757.1 hypothetical protein HMPREF9713_01598 [Myroides odoratimimus CCUG 12700]MDM1097379.1 DUF58 domain-containing protein [Myroides odoratimim
MFKLFKQLYLQKRVYMVLGAIIALFVLAFIFPILYKVVWGLFVLFFAIILVDITLLFNKKNKVNAVRILPEKLSNGDDNTIYISIENKYNITVQCDIIDEIPFQFQKRDFEITKTLAPKEQKTLSYTLRPTTRGEYVFGKLNVYISSPLKLVSRRFVFCDDVTLATYPSFIQMKKYDLIAFSKNKYAFGMKKIRKIGTTTEFEQIKEYVLGDDIRNINWKATAKSSQLMVNQFQDENTESVYNIIDRGRVMQMPFNGLSLLDYAINSTLALSNVILKKNDKVGLMTFSENITNQLPAESKISQLQKVMEQLYRVNTNFVESDFGKLYAHIRHKITHRSLIILYTNFESLSSLKRQLPYLRAIAKNHVLLVVFFENTELTKLTEKKAKNTDDIFDKVIAEKFNFEKRLIVNELTKYGIQSILTAPEELSINTINKYLQIKAKGTL